MIDWLFYPQYHFANACSQSSTMEMEFPNGTVSNDIFFRESRELKSVD